MALPTKAMTLTSYEGCARLSLCAAGHGEKALREMRGKLLARRSQRTRPGWDDKVLADWNGLMIAALVHAAKVLDRPDRGRHAGAR